MTKQGLENWSNGVLEKVEFVLAWTTFGAMLAAAYVGMDVVDAVQIGLIWLVLLHLWRTE